MDTYLIVALVIGVLSTLLGNISLRMIAERDVRLTINKDFWVSMCLASLIAVLAWYTHYSSV